MKEIIVILLLFVTISGASYLILNPVEHKQHHKGK